ncbi:MAG TPA: type IV secretion system DNA-binding domain-containing protein [Candidatus Paceibacterota bacterium]|nr:type IV secretion system DNA-binding domain-containing protein [Candidatus Paceibacterota bacterium]HPT18269.1 type IV secretion system DNA-binding domain-containing protein [Candidatus Paceibacterota bacterium]
MEGLFSKEIPKFKTPEEELSFLRAHIEKRERELKANGQIEHSTENVAKNVILEYKEAPANEIIHKDNLLSKRDTQEIVLKLKPETHDAVMEELLGVVITKGIKNALEIVSSMNNPHVDDDFQRLLVQYLKTGQIISGLKEGSPLYRELNMTLFEITLPPPIDEADKQKSFKEFISAMEQFYAGMQSISVSVNNEREEYFSLEVALSSESDQVVIYAAIPNKHISLFEKQVLAFYHDAKIKEVPDDYNIFNEKGYSVGAYATFAERAVLPIKTYDSIEHDPMNMILNAFSKLKTNGEGAAIQILIAPAGNKFINEFHKILDDVKDGISVKHADDNLYKFNKAFLKASKELLFNTEKKTEEKKEKYMKGRRAVDEGAVEKIGNKLKSSILKANIRIVASGENKERAEAILRELESSFNQFTEAASNRIFFEQISGNELKKLFHDFSYRAFSHDKILPMNLKELSSVFHFPVGISGQAQLKEAKAGISPAPIDMSQDGIVLGINSYRGRDTMVRLNREDRMRHFYVIGQTGTGKTNVMLNMITQDIKNGDGCCYIDPHGTDIQTILSRIPKERIDDVIYFDPAYTARPMGLNMLEFDPKYPEQKTFVVNELMGIFNKLFDMKTSGGPMFEQYFKNSAFLIMEDPESGCTLLEISRVLADKQFRDMKLAKCKNPIIKQFWISAEQTTGDQSLANFVPYITSKFDNFISNDIMRPVVLQEKSVFDFRKIMDEKKILLVNLSKGRLGEMNANLIGLVLVGKIQMAALSRVDMFGKQMNDFYLYIDEFQNVTTDSIASILSEARKYRLSLNVAHQYISQLEESIKNAVFGNVGSMAVFRVSSEDAEFLEKRFQPTFKSADIMKLDNYNAYVSMLVKGQPTKPFNIYTLPPEKGNPEIVESLKELSYLKYGRDREEIESEIMHKYERQQ